MSTVSIGQVESEEQRPVVLIGSIAAICDASAHLSLPPAILAIRATFQGRRSAVRHSFPNFPTLSMREMRTHQDKKRQPLQRSGNRILIAAVLLKYGNQALGTFTSRASSQDHESGSWTIKHEPVDAESVLRTYRASILVGLCPCFICNASNSEGDPEETVSSKIENRKRSEIKRPGRRAYDGKTRGAETHHSRRR